MRVEPSSTELAPRDSGTPPASAVHIAGSADAEPNLPVVDLSALSALHLPVEPGLLALRLKSEPSGQGLFDGAWWPHSRDVHAELPGLVTVLSEHLGPIDRVGLDADAWDGLGEPLVVEGRHVEVEWFPVGEDTILVSRGGLDNFALLAIAPDASVDEAHAAMTMATHIGNTETGQQILVATGIAAPAWHGTSR
ncbi:hypothetical protein HCC61_25280 [Streptomyces sp. HNM0575]|uniref:DUF5994 family protein n=1 Tax=Streptomyces sp. HNM0575 TaxID=2716338 RepID=UPI00145CDADB|nr:DUF5994 family protein [Streptomyces sp. HNM0575]NLU75925.1 hypothetical protein [Streptomyces sp. HNM0575]